MDKDYCLDSFGSFSIRDYNTKNTFSNFLPGIAGQWGVPMWVFYVNRGQAVVSFGINDKNHAIAEFFPANKAYTFVSSLGFRTFLKINKNICYEPFSVNHHSLAEQTMLVNNESLVIEEINKSIGLQIRVKYFTLPHTNVAGLVRQITVKNISSKTLSWEMLDGFSRIIPFGMANFFMKDMCRTIEAWMHSAVDKGLMEFRLIVDPKDVSQTEYVQGVNFAYSFYEDKGVKKFPYLIVDPDAIFSFDKSYAAAVNFFAKGFKIPLAQINCGKTPCAFSYLNFDLKSGQEKTLYEIYGASFQTKLVKKFTQGITAEFIAQKEQVNEELIGSLKNNALSLSGKPEFDQYIKSCYLDNVLRGGYPFRFSQRDVYYIYSRKHGDLERDYNYFKLLPSYFSEGEANYRDINQNRRIDLFFDPRIGDGNIIYFFNLLKIDGYNPLTVRGEILYFEQDMAEQILAEFAISDRKLLTLMVNGFQLGEFFKIVEENNIKIKDKSMLAKAIISKANREPNAVFGEGFWIDHWRYNLDLIEAFAYFYPEKICELFTKPEYVFWDDHCSVKPRSARYKLHNDKVYQIHSVEESHEKQRLIEERGRFKNCLRVKNNGIYKTTLVEKLLSLILNKAATLDPCGIGVEMEANKPGWCDSLNGLPAMLGSSLCETLEIKRSGQILITALAQLKKNQINSVRLSKEIAQFFNNVSEQLTLYANQDETRRDYLWWDNLSRIREEFRAAVFFNLSGEQSEISLDTLSEFLVKLIKKLDCGVAKSTDKKTNIPVAYFRYNIKKYSLRNENIIPEEFQKIALPLFLEGPVHALRNGDFNKRELYQAVRKSPLYDRKLKMYRLNASLKNEPLEIGRSRIFVPGWLENESIWLHMEYKYLLEILKCELYDEFFQEFAKCCVAFFDPQQYGRSILENSSFIVSSAYPDKSLWGKGFVARLSGATVELLHIWMFMCLGKQPFYVNKAGKLVLKFAPILSADLFTKKETSININGKVQIIPENSFAFKLFSTTLVVYHNPRRRPTYQEILKVSRIELRNKNGEVITQEADILSEELVIRLRNQEFTRIDVILCS